jgi:hypothetical protein
MAKRRCTETNKRGERCGFPPQRENDLCWLHDPEHAEAAQEARRTGGMRRKRENTLSGAFDFAGIESEGGLARLLDIAAFDTLAQEAGHQKARTLVAIVVAGEKVLHAKELEERVEALESVLGDGLKKDGRR